MARHSAHQIIQQRRRHEACYYGWWGLLGHLIGAVLPILVVPVDFPAYGLWVPLATFFAMFAVGHILASIGARFGGGRYGQTQ